MLDVLAYPLVEADYRAADHRWLAELDGRAVHAGPPYQRLGTKALAEDVWFAHDDRCAAELALKRRLLAEVHPAVFACLPEAADAAAETLELVAGWLAARMPHLASAVRAEAAAGRNPLEAASLGVQDDLCLMQRDEAGWRLTGASLCFPTNWTLHDKLGHHQEVVHDPVPHYAADLAAQVNTFFDRLAPDRIVTRRNWSVTPHLLLFLPGRGLVPIDPAVPIESLWVRSERQSLRRLPAAAPCSSASATSSPRSPQLPTTPRSRPGCWTPTGRRPPSCGPAASPAAGGNGWPPGCPPWPAPPDRSRRPRAWGPRRRWFAAQWGIVVPRPGGAGAEVNRCAPPWPVPSLGSSSKPLVKAMRRPEVARGLPHFGSHPGAEMGS